MVFVLFNPLDIHSLARRIGGRRDGHHHQHTHKYIHPIYARSLSPIAGFEDGHLQQQPHKYILSIGTKMLLSEDPGCPILAVGPVKNWIYRL